MGAPAFLFLSLFFVFSFFPCTHHEEGGLYTRWGHPLAREGAVDVVLIIFWGSRSRSRVEGRRTEVSIRNKVGSFSLLRQASGSHSTPALSVSVSRTPLSPIIAWAPRERNTAARSARAIDGTRRRHHRRVESDDGDMPPSRCPYRGGSSGLNRDPRAFGLIERHLPDA